MISTATLRIAFVALLLLLGSNVVQSQYDNSEGMIVAASDKPSKGLFTAADGRIGVSDVPSSAPSTFPSGAPFTKESAAPSAAPFTKESDVPSAAPSDVPSAAPFTKDSDMPSAAPFTKDSDMPSTAPFTKESDVPSLSPSFTTDLPSSSDMPTGSDVESILDIINSDAELVVFAALFTISQLELSLTDTNYTIFAPNDSAIQSLVLEFPDADSFTDPGFVLHVQRLLQLHIINEEFQSPALTNGTILNPELSGAELTIIASNISVSVLYEGIESSSATVYEADLVADGGVVHKVENVLVPDFLRLNIVKALEFEKDIYSFSKILAYVQSSSEASDLLSEVGGKFTFFAPLDSSFAKIAGNGTRTLQQNLDLADVIFAHTVPDVLPSLLVGTGTLTSVLGTTIDVVVDATGVTVNGVSVVTFDVLASNGVIHGIDGVLEAFPPATPTTPAPVAPSPVSVPLPVAPITQPPVKKSPRANPARRRQLK